MSELPSRNHPNRQAHNWAVYDCGDRILIANRDAFHGVVYDLGCGEMPYRDWILQRADSYTGVDWSATLHDLRADIVANLNEPLPVPDAIADTVVSLSVMEHLCEPQVMLDEAFRILKQRGNIVLQVPWQWQIHEAPHDYFRYTPYGLRYMLQKAGFVDIVVEPQAGYFTTAVMKWNYFTKRFVRGPKIVRWLVKAVLVPFWYIGQKFAPLLDRLDRHWALEASGFYVVARKH